MSKSVKSSVPGMKYPSGRDHVLKTSNAYIEGRQKDDGAEGLWRIQDSLYDLRSFVENHPGGAEWLTLTKGTDITEAFESHHISNKADQLLPKFYVRKATTERSLPYTFHPDGFYRKFKARAYEALKNVDYHNPSLRTIFYADLMISLTLLTAVAATIFKSWIIVAISGLFLAYTSVIAHNFFHMKDNFRMYYLDLSMMSSKDWRVSHTLSHHLYPNTLWDMECYALEPFIDYLPRVNQHIVHRIANMMIWPVVYSISTTVQGLKRYYSIWAEWNRAEFRDLVPFFLPIVMSFFASSIYDAVGIWLSILMISSFIFHFIGLTANHHHPEIFHDGDVCRKDIDWGLMEMDAVREREIIDDSYFLGLTLFGLHALHHLLPTVDHDYLELCIPALRETCREFGVDNARFSPWELIKGHYKQMMRTDGRLNYRGAH